MAKELRLAGCTVVIRYLHLYRGSHDDRGPCGCHISPTCCQFTRRPDAQYLQAYERCRKEADDKVDDLFSRQPSIKEMFRILYNPENARAVSPNDHPAQHAIADGIVPTCRIRRPVLAPQPKARQLQPAESWTPVGHTRWKKPSDNQESGSAGYAVPLGESEWPRLGHQPVVKKAAPYSRSSSSSGLQASETTEDANLSRQFEGLMLDRASKAKAPPAAVQMQAYTPPSRAPPVKAITAGMKECAAKNLRLFQAQKRSTVEVMPSIEESGPPAKHPRAASLGKLPPPVSKPKPGTVARPLSPAQFNASLLADDRSCSRPKPAPPQAPWKSRSSSVPPKPRPPAIVRPQNSVVPVPVGRGVEAKQQAPTLSKILEMKQKRKAAEALLAENMEVESESRPQVVPAPSLGGSEDSVLQPPLCVTSMSDEEGRKELLRRVTEVRTIKAEPPPVPQSVRVVREVSFGNVDYDQAYLKRKEMFQKAKKLDKEQDGSAYSQSEKYYG
jgi:hypothetical protein